MFQLSLKGFLWDNYLGDDDSNDLSDDEDVSDDDGSNDALT